MKVKDPRTHELTLALGRYRYRTGILPIRICVTPQTISLKKTSPTQRSYSGNLHAGVRYRNGSVSDQDLGGSGFKLSDWIRIRIRNPDPESEIEL